MSESTLCLKPITDLLGERFYLPAYQRGYRWTARQVTDLLDDILSFHKESDRKGKEAFYCLQPVVVMKRDEGDYELIDGQQRLTTIFLVLTFLLPWVERLRKSRFELQYETRPGSAEFLKNLDMSRIDENIDYYHICRSYETIERWFSEHDSSFEMIVLNCLLNSDEIGKNVKVIWYELPQGQNPVDAFVRLNMGKIPLTNSELIRGLFLRSRNFEEGEVSLKQLQIAHEWDSIEKTMQASDFWGFLYGGTDVYPARIEYLFELITSDMDTEGIQDDDTYRTFIAYSRYFESLGDDKEPAWKDVKTYFMTCDEWFRDRTLYHLVGYLITQGKNVQELKSMSENLGKSAFQRVLKLAVFQELFEGNPAEHNNHESLRDLIMETLRDLSYDRSSHYGKIRSALLLFNIATLLQNPTSNIRFPFDSFKDESWDLEHIKSVKSEIPERRDEQKRWLQSVVEFWQNEDGTTPAGLDERRDELLDRIHSFLDATSMSNEKATELFGFIYGGVLDYFQESEVSEVENGLQNLTLLDAGTNRGYKNAVFPIKRGYVRALDKTGTFVPLCTTNVFLKYYSRDIDRMLFWTDSDRQDYFNAIVDTLTDFFAVESGGGL
jgi:hypothetical protein